MTEGFYQSVIELLREVSVLAARFHVGRVCIACFRVIVGLCLLSYKGSTTRCRRAVISLPYDWALLAKRYKTCAYLCGDSDLNQRLERSWCNDQLSFQCDDSSMTSRPCIVSSNAEVHWWVGVWFPVSGRCSIYCHPLVQDADCIPSKGWMGVQLV